MALLSPLLEPIEELRQYDVTGDFTSRLALMEALKGMPFGAVWDYYCLQKGVPVGEIHPRDQTLRARSTGEAERSTSGRAVVS
jgi:L-rhamnose isomerase